MKRMSEVFELPLESMQDASDQLQDANGDWVLVVRFPWRADYAAHAINHADALADALADLIEQSTNYAANFKSEYYAAIDALEAYRGAK